MKLRMTWQLQEPHAILPASYKYEVSAWLYRLMRQGNPEFSRFLHQHGFGQGNRKFKFFTFSDLKVPASGRRLIDDRLHISSPKIQLDVSLYLPRATRALLDGMMRLEDPQFSIGDMQSKGTFVLAAVEALTLHIHRRKYTFAPSRL